MDFTCIYLSPWLFGQEKWLLLLSLIVVVLFVEDAKNPTPKPGSYSFSHLYKRRSGQQLSRIYDITNVGMCWTLWLTNLAELSMHGAHGQGSDSFQSDCIKLIYHTVIHVLILQPLNPNLKDTWDFNLFSTRFSCCIPTHIIGWRRSNNGIYAAQTSVVCFPRESYNLTVGHRSKGQLAARPTAHYSYTVSYI